MHIESALVCEPLQIFNLSQGGLVVFGSRVPRLLPQWWGVGLGNDTDAIQAAVDAGIHNRGNVWEEPIYRDDGTLQQYAINRPLLPPIPVELRGDYHLRRPIEVRGGVTQNRVLEILEHRTVRRLPPNTTSRDVLYVGMRAGNRTAVIPTDFANSPAVAIRVSVDETSVATAVISNDGHTIVVTGHRVGGTTLRVTRSTRLGELTEVVTVQVEDPVLERRVLRPTSSSTVIAGVWHGRTACGARLIASPEFAGETLLRLSNTPGLTLRNVAFEVADASGPTCLDIMPGVPPAVMRNIAVRGCSFTGGDATLVRVGPPPAIVAPADPLLGTPPLAESSNYGSDISCLAFDECEFLPRSEGIGVMVRSSQSVPFRLRTCNFIGVARAMISAWEGTFLLDSCNFENSPPSTPRPLAVQGFEEPDGADIYLHFEPPWRLRFVGGVMMPYLTDTLAAFTATGCVSRSPRFLSTAHPSPSIAQRQEWPVLLMNVRHVPPPQNQGGVSIEWGMVNRTSSITTVGGRGTARLGRGGSLVILGGQYHGSFRVLPGAAQSVIVGARGLGATLMWPDLTEPRSLRITWPTDVFGLEYDRR